jgi:NAD(P)-dependent dehydrogenase (short-subunit alcohol dehydrogenase family)
LGAYLRLCGGDRIQRRLEVAHFALSNSIRRGMHGYLKTLSNELAPDGITANIVAAGRLTTARMSQIFPKTECHASSS